MELKTIICDLDNLKVRKVMKWISTEYIEPKNEKSLYWVFDGEEVIQARLNDYKILGGYRNWWQDLNHNDFTMTGTSYIEIKKPEPPKDK